MSQRDPVTDLPGGAHFDGQLSSLLFHAGRDGREIAVSILDLRALKLINREFGWDEGDRVLREFAQALRSQAPESSHIWHLGGDAFVIALESAEPALTADVLDRVSQAAGAISAGGRVVAFAAGTAIFPADGRTAKGLLNVADARMHAQRG